MADITRWDPFGEITRLRTAVDRLFDESFARPWRLLGWEAEGVLPLDVYETENDLVVKASMPGVRPEEVDISITGDALTIKGEAKAEHEERKPNYYRQELRYGAFHRTLTLPVQVEADKAEATFENGLLTLTMPKAEAARPKTIKVKAVGAIEAEKK